MRRIFAPLAAALLSGCAGAQGLVPETPSAYLADRALNHQPSPANFSFCVEHGCAKVTPAGFTAAEWETIREPLATPASDAASERRALAEVVARFEATTRRSLRLRPDLAGTYPGAFSADQNDCVDETANTTTLLLMLDAEGLLRRHRVGAPAMRGVFVDIALPHRSATLQDTATGARFVLDSWFRRSGAPADIASLDVWLNGWTPSSGARS